MASRAYDFALLFLILRATRGGVGVAIVSSFIQQNWVLFQTDFTALCKKLQ